MTKSISPETKSSTAFLYSKVNGLNNREATRFAELFTGNEDFELLCKSHHGIMKLSAYRAFCKEPNIDKNHYFHVTFGNHEELSAESTRPTEQKQSRSKLVMAYEKQRKAYLKVKQLRAIKPTEVDEILSHCTPYELNVPSGMTYRTAVLQEVLRNISTAK